MLRALFRLGLVAGVLATALGLAAPLLPHLELINQFRPYLLAATLAIAALGFGLSEAWRRAAIAVAAINLVLFAVPLTMSAKQVSDATRSEQISLVTLNLGFSERHISEIASYLTLVDADIVVLQELKIAHAEQMLPELKQRYPHQVICELCGIAVLTKSPVRDVSESPSGRWVSGLWTSSGGQVQRIVGLHLSWPLQPEWQQADVAEMIAVLGGWAEPKIVAGDFNLSPWTWKFNKITWTTGLTRHGTFAFSWPVYSRVAEKHGLPWLPMPSFVLIDNVLTSPEISGESFVPGPDLGSDHRPVAVRLRLP